MSYSLSSSKYARNQENINNIRDLNEERKEEIMRELQDELDNMKAKYKLEQRDKNSQKLSDIKSLDTLTNRDREQVGYQNNKNYQEEIESNRDILKKSKFREENFNKNPEESDPEIDHEEGYEYQDENQNYPEERQTIFFNRNINDDDHNNDNYQNQDQSQEKYENYNYPHNDQSQDYEKFPEQEEPHYSYDNLDKNENEYNHENEHQSNYIHISQIENKIPSKNITSYAHSHIDSIKDLQSSKRSNNNSELINFKRNVTQSKMNSKEGSIANKDQFSQGSQNVSNYELFDKAKENLLKIKSELDEMDQFDYRNRTPGNNSVIKQYSNNQSRIGEDRSKHLQKEYDLDEYLVQEEKPKNLEEEISMSMSIAYSIKEDSQIMNQSQYRFNAPYVSGLSANLSPIQASQKENREKNLEIKRQMNNYMPTPASTHRYHTARTVNNQSVQGSSRMQNPEQKQGNAASTGSIVSNQSHLKRAPVGSATATLEKDRGRSPNKTHIKNVHNPYNRSKSSSGEKETEKDRKNSPYFKKMIKEYNPKYKRAESKSKFEKIKAEVESKFEKEHTFKPQVNYSKVFSQHEKVNLESKDELYNRLSTPKIVDLNKRLKEKEAQDTKKMTEECTFHPNLNLKFGSMSNLNEQGTTDRQYSENKEKVENRLYKLAEQMKEKREKMKREYQDNLIKDYSFTPNIDNRSKQLMLKYEKQKPIHERYDEVIRNKRQNLQSMRENIEKQGKSMYKPEINSKSKDIIMRRTERSFNGDLNIHERLYRDGLNKNRQKLNSDNLLDDEECTFSPQLFYSTTQPGGNIDDFLERQKIYEEIKKERLERKLSKSIENNQYTFSPKINLTSDILMKADHMRSNEDIKDKVDRLYKEDFEKLKNRKEQLEKCYYAQYDFKPKINEISRFVGRDPTIDDLYMKKESSKVRKIKEEATIQEECSFKPKINKNKFENIHSNYKPDENILKRIQDELKNKNEKVEEIKNLMEEKNMQECKFQPDIKKDTPNYDTREPIVMKGFAKHIEQMEKARKAKRDKEEREKEVFTTGDNWSRDNLITIPKPFKLSYLETNKNKKDEIIKKNKEMEMRECTFKPSTNESKNKEIIRMILKN